MYVESILELRSIDVSKPTLLLGSNRVGLYSNSDAILYASRFDSLQFTTIHERIVAIADTDLINKGIPYYNEVSGGTNNFKLLPPNATGNKLVLTSYNNTQLGDNIVLEWVDINTLVNAVDTYWDRNTHGLYPTTTTDSVAIGVAANTTTSGYMLYTHGSSWTSGVITGATDIHSIAGNIYTSDGNVATYAGNILTKGGNIYTDIGHIYTSAGNINVMDGWFLYDRSYGNTGPVNLSTRMNLSLETTMFSGREQYRIGSRSIETVFNDTGYGFKRTRTIDITGNTYDIDFSAYEIDVCEIKSEGHVIIYISNPVVNKIYTLDIWSPHYSTTIAFPDEVRCLSGSFIGNFENYIQIMCIADGANPKYLVTINQPDFNNKASGNSITMFNDVPNTWSTLKGKILRVDDLGTELIGSSLMGAEYNSTDGYIPTWSGNSALRLGAGYGVSYDLGINNSDSYLVRADAIKNAIDTSKVQEVSSNAYIDEDTKLVLVTKSNEDITLTFPNRSISNRAAVCKVKDITMGDNDYKIIIIVESDAYTIEGSNSYNMTGNNMGIEVIFKNNYFVM